ncbi:MAG: NAD(P)-dependent oxidoreductase [Planctomycetota bacterium]
MNILWQTVLLVSLGAADRDPGWVSLFDGASLAGWRISDFAGGGPVSVDDGRMQLGFGQPLTGVSYTKELPRTGFELEVRAARVDGNDFFCGLTFPVGEEHATLIPGGWGGALVGLSCIDGADASSNETTSFRRFNKGQEVRLRVRVTDSRVKAWIDDELVAAVRRDGHSFSLRPEMLPSLPLGLSSYMSRGGISLVRIRILGQLEELPEPLHDLGLEEGPSPTRGSAGWTRPKKVVVLDPGDGWRERFLEAAPGVELVFVKGREEAVGAVEDGDGLIGLCDAALVGQGGHLRWIQVGSAGVERYLADPELVKREIVLTNGKRLAGVPIAEHALALLLFLSRGLRTAVESQEAGEWDRAKLVQTEDLVELHGKTLLVLGLGGIGTEVARRADALGMRVLATRRSSREGPEYVEKVGLPDEAVTLAREADVVVNCLPHTAETEQVIGRAFFDAMKESALFINVGRGRTVDTEALTKALRKGSIQGAGLDVTDPEPLPSDHPLWRLPNVLITPHVAARSREQGDRMLWLYVENLRRFATGEPLLNVVDKQAGY